MCPSPFLSRRSTVSDDWRSWLRQPQDQVFRWTGGELEAGYTMLSVTLNEAMALRGEGASRKARQEAGCCGELVVLLAMPLAGTLRALQGHARHYGTLPNTVPLDSANFRCSRSQRVAWIHGLLCQVLFSDRSQFFHKLHSLEGLVEELSAEFRETAIELSGGMATDPAGLWESLDDLHYDLNTCLRETLVVLKSFLRVLPEEEVDTFRRNLENQAKATAAGTQEQGAAPRDRRPAPISRK